MKETVKQNQSGATEKPNDLAHRHGGEEKLAAESGADKIAQNAASGDSPAVFGAAPCSLLGVAFIDPDAPKKVFRITGLEEVIEE